MIMQCNVADFDACEAFFEKAIAKNTEVLIFW